MTPEVRLTQAEKFLETAARYIDRHSQAIAQNAQDISQLRAAVNDTLQLFSELATYQRQSQEEIRQNQQEIQRIWEYLSTQSGNGRARN
jgi:cell division protein ZapA (FtsZ GTPase activity inhibitor)